MTTRSVTHGEFTIEREYDAPPSRVFAAWATQEAKDEWYGTGDTEFMQASSYSLDFKVGGVEFADGILPSGRRFVFRGVHNDIVENERIVMTYDVLIDGQRISVSLLTVEFLETDAGTKLVTTEQGTFLDGLDTNEQRVLGATRRTGHARSLHGGPAFCRVIISAHEPDRGEPHRSLAVRSPSRQDAADGRPDCARVATSASTAIRQSRRPRFAPVTRCTR